MFWIPPVSESIGKEGSYGVAWCEWSDYQEEIKVLHNGGEEEYVWPPGDPLEQTSLSSTMPCD
jgi:hypothetical protein